MAMVSTATPESSALLPFREPGLFCCPYKGLGRIKGLSRKLQLSPGSDLSFSSRPESGGGGGLAAPLQTRLREEDFVGDSGLINASSGRVHSAELETELDRLKGPREVMGGEMGQKTRVRKKEKKNKIVELFYGYILLKHIYLKIYLVAIRTNAPYEGHPN